MGNSYEDGFSKAVIRGLRDRVAGWCSNPDCGAPTLGPDQSTTDKVKITGRGCHMRAASKGGPRYDESQSAEDRSSIENGIWLCSRCSDLIDKNDGRDFPLDVLLGWKREAESRAAKSQAKGESDYEAAWEGSLSTVHYVNIPRLSMLLAGTKEYTEINQYKFADFRGLGFGLVRIMVDVEKAISRANLSAVPISRFKAISEEHVGITLSFRSGCRTKNGPAPDEPFDTKLLAKFDENRSPHFYLKQSGFRAVFPYDPRWITTNTAFSDFSRGNVSFAGLGILKAVNRTGETAIISPLIVGLPKPEFDLDSVLFSKG